MNKLKLILLMLSMITMINLKCDQGCTRCVENRCELCDSSAGKTLMQGNCVKSVVGNCKELLFGGLCVGCIEYYFLDPQVNRCIPLTEGDKIPNCFYYVDENTCKTCVAGFYELKGQCVATTSTIENCLFYKNANQCGVCKNGFSVYLSQTACIENPKIKDCVSFSTTRCIACMNANYLELNYLLFGINQKLESFDRALLGAAVEVFTQKQIKINNECLAPSVKNCQVFSAFDACSKCSAGYFLKNKKCYAFPKEIIPNCSVYKKEDECTTCQMGFFRKSSKECAPVDVIANCELFNPQASETICTKCWNLFYLKNNACLTRTNLVNLCQKYSLSSDKCSVCSNGYSITTDGLKCLKTVENCQTYISSSITSTSLTCEQCQPLYYLENVNICKKGTVPFCWIYKTNQNSCIECSEKNWVSNGTCIPHSVVEFCQNYDKTVADTCIACNSESVLMTKTTKCTPVMIEGCQIYTSATECQVCKDGYDQINNQECKVLDQGLNCIRAVNGQCSKCTVNFVLQSGKCRLPYDYEVQYCQKTNVDGTLSDHNNVACMLCLAGSFPYNYQDNYVCVQNDELKLLLKGNNLVPFCLGYEMVNNNYACTRCQDNKVLKNGACVNNCGKNEVINFKTPLKRFIFENNLNDSNLTKLKNVDFCETEDKGDFCNIKTLSVDDNGNYSDFCIDEDLSKGKVVELNNKNVIIFKKEDLNLEAKSENIYKKSIYTNTDLTLIKGCSNVNKKLQMLNTCDYFGNIVPSLTDKGCLKCRFGQFGRVINWKVAKCHTYDSATKQCTVCVHGYYPTNVGLVCTKIEIPSCYKFSLVEAKCLLCDKGFYLNSLTRTQCLPLTERDNCQYYSTHQDKCVKCDEGFILNNDQNSCQKSIEKCWVHNKAFTTPNSLTCTSCEDGFALTSDFKKCQCGNVINCWKYAQDGTNTCTQYMNTFLFEITNTCEAPTLIDHCSIYASATTCSQCESNYYLSTQSVAKKCCKNKFFYNGTDCSNPINLDNCLENNTNQTNATCSKCDKMYYLSQGVCCPYGMTYDNGKCTNLVHLNSNTYNCGVWDQLIHRCHTCKTGFYKLDVDSICCAENKYLDANKNCQSITMPGCLQANSTGMVCNKCISGSFLRSNGLVCCDAENKVYSGGSCALYSTINANCSTSIITNTRVECTACNATYYLTNNFCCLSTQYYNTSTSNCATRTPVIASCVEYDSAQKCTKCVSGKIITNNGNTCCDDNTIWDSKVCHPKLTFFENCLAIEQDFNSNTASRYCRVCQKDFYSNFSYCVGEGKRNDDLNAIATSIIDKSKNCLQVNDTNTTCTKCKLNYYQVASNLTQCCPDNTFWDGTNSVCVSFQEYFLNLARINKTTFSSSTCMGTEDTSFYVSASKCCELGYRNKDGQCVPITLDNCLKSDNDTTCLQCKSGYYVDSGTNLCIAQMTNCVKDQTAGVAGSQTCDKCITGYLNTTANTACTAYATYFDPSKIAACSSGYTSDLCYALASGTDCFCGTNTKCSPFGYNQSTNSCCPLGYSWNIDSKTCMKIINPYCAIYKANSSECEFCFLNENYCTLIDLHLFSLKATNYSEVNNSNLKSKYDNETAFIYLGSDTKMCCPYGKYWGGSSCVNNPVQNCWKYENGLCSLCKDEYKLDNNFCCKFNEIYDTFYKTCIVNDSGVTCPTGLYKSNNHCCAEKKYWDLQLDRCMPLFDTNCLQSDSKTTCSKCALNYSLENNFKYTVNLNFETHKSCINPNEFFVIQFCISNTTVSANLEYPDLVTQYDNCSIFDNTTSYVCTSCKSDAYKTATISNCCLDFSFHYLNKCRPLEDLVQNCENYDHTTRKCLKCKVDSNEYFLEKGICCPKGKFLNAMTMKCDYIDLNCKTFDSVAGVCAECNDKAYYTNSHCCNEGYFYDVKQKSCVLISGQGLDKCLRLDDFGTCQKCSDLTNFYFHKKHCCPNATYWNGEYCATPSKDDVLCSIFGYFNECLTCKAGNYLAYFSRCCPFNKFYDNISKKCRTNYKFSNCMTYKSDGTACLTCQDTYYKTNDHCCKDTYYWNSTKNICISINKPLLLNCAQPVSDDALKCKTCKTGSYLHTIYEQCCPYNYYYNPITLSCESIGSSLIDCAETDDNINCFGCKSSGNVAIKDSTTNLYTCKTQSAPINCIKATGTTNGTCVYCKSGYYPHSSNKDCCQFGYYSSAVGTCSTITISSNCATADDNTACLKCNDGHYLSNGHCVEFGKWWDGSAASGSETKLISITGNSNCAKATNSSTCTGCNIGYDFQSGSCNSITNQTTLANSGGSFDRCDSGKYKAYSATTSICCSFGEYYKASSSSCVDMSTPLLDPLLDGCIEYSNSLCEKCIAGKYLSNGYCCLENYYFNQSACAKLSTPGLGLHNCRIYFNSTTCNSKSSDLSPTGRLNSCLSGDYYHNKHCCPILYYWNGTACALLTTGLSLTDCDMVDENNKCIRCINSKYISNGYCCSNGTFLSKNSTTCVAITRSFCIQISGLSCLSCSDGFVNPDFPQCCSKQYYSSANICVDKPNNCKTVNNLGECLTCDSTYYLTNKRCCLNGYYFNGTECVAISGNTDCIQTADYNTAVTGLPLYCAACIDFKKVRNGKCCLIDELYFLDKGCMKASLIEKVCMRLADDGSCSKCQDPLYSSSGACCPIGTKLDTNTLTCIPITSTGCNKESLDQCFGCLDTFYLNISDRNVTLLTQKCCPLGVPLKTDKTDCDIGSSLITANCNSFDLTTRACKSCISGYNLYKNFPSTTPANVCCQDGKYWNGTECELFGVKPLDCKNFDIITMNCIECVTDFYLQNNKCCKIGTYWSANSKCESITIPNCTQQNGTNCTVCKDSFYLKNNGCCLLQYYWDNVQNKCIGNSEQFCAKYDFVTSKCYECSSNPVNASPNPAYANVPVYLYKDHCCKQNTVWEGGKCQEVISNCAIYERNVADNKWLCNTCMVKPGIIYMLSADKKSCCPSNSFFFENEPVDQQCVSTPSPLLTKVVPHCLSFDYATIHCTMCEDGFYISNGVCCANGRYKILSNSLGCDPIPNAATNYCINYDGTNCTGCAQGYKLKASNKTCVLIIPDCKTFNEETNVCTECFLGKYVSSNNCCPEGTYWVTSACVPTTVTRCLRNSTPSTCSKCEEGYYLTGANFCCQNEKYCPDSSTANPGLVKNCMAYGTSTLDCSTCHRLYSKIVINAGVNYCYPVPQQKNCASSALTVSSGKNLLTCTCQDQFYSTPYSGIFKPIYEHYFHPNEFCTQFKNKFLFDASDLTCLGCDTNRFWNGTSCVLRSGAETFDNCRAPFKPDMNGCITCKDGFWYNSASFTCIANNSPDPTCLYYNSSLSKCDVCKPNNGSGDDYLRILQINGSWPVCSLRSTFNGQDLEAADPNLWPGYIEECRENYECKKDYFNGLPVQLEKLVSCHICNDNSKIPFVSIRAGVDTNTLEGLQKYKVGLANTLNLNQFSDDNVNFSNQCLNKDLSEFVLVGVNNFATNCAIGIINSNNKPDASESHLAAPASGKLGLYCGACKPGFAPTYTAKVFHVSACLVISNCEVSGTAFNECDKCLYNYAFGFSNNTINRSVCVNVLGNPFCYSFDSANNNCVICKKGYSLNLENVCELLNAPYCENEKMAQNLYLKKQSYELAIYRDIVGCQVCKDGYSGLFKPGNEFVCTDSPYLKKGIFRITNPAFNVNCLQYGINAQNEVYCNSCKTNFVLISPSADPNNKYGKCLAQSGNLANCQLGTNSGVCTQCVDNYTLQNNLCVLKTIKNCAVYSNTGSILTCTTCANYFYLLNNTCLEGTISDCLVYTNKNACSQCNEGHQKILLKDNVDYCIPVTTHQNCLTYNNQSFQNQTITCSSCKADFILETLTNNQKVCNRIQLVSHCSKYDINTTFLTSTLKCSECFQGYYLVNNECRLRTLALQNCLKYTVTNDTCDQCEDEYYLSQNNTECLINPFGISGCAIFQDDKNCLVCKSSYYLESNKCVLVPTANLILSCVEYANSSVCSRCDTGLALDGNKCMTPVVQNCDDFINSKSCKTCKVGFGLKPSGDMNLCESLPVIASCSTVATIYPFVCTKCADGYYLNGETCTIVDPIILNCQEYSAINQCSKCIKNFIVSRDNKSCFLYTTDNNCAAFKEEENPFCVLCSPGFILNSERNCVALGSNSSKKNPGCLVFNYYDASICEICKNKFYMDENRMCIEVLTDEEKKNQFNETDANADPNINPFIPPNQKTASIAYTFMLIVLTFLS